MSTAWSIWKENQQIFDQHQLNQMQVEQEIKSEIMVQKVASGEPEIPLVSWLVYLYFLLWASMYRFYVISSMKELFCFPYLNDKAVLLQVFQKENPSKMCK